MMKKFSKILAAILTLCMVATLCAIPMTASAEETYEAYDEIGYADLNNGSMAAGSTVINGQPQYDYLEKVSSTHSVIARFRITLQNTSKFQMHFGHWGDKNNFGYRLDGGNWVWYGDGSAVSAGTVAVGNTYDIEMARLLVKSGSNAGKYFTYFKVNDVTLFEKYVAADDKNTYDYTQNRVYFNDKGGSSGNILSAYVQYDPETFEDYDVIEYANLDNGSMAAGSTALPDNDNSYKYVSASASNSAILKFRVTMGDTSGRFEMHFSGWGKNNNFAYKWESAKWKWLATGEAVNPARSLVAGDTCDIEMARLKVATGRNAGKYYTYFMVDGITVFRNYVAADDTNTTNYLGDKAYFYQQIKEPAYTLSEYVEPTPEVYDAYDMVGYSDLLDNGNPLGAETTLSNKTFTYDQTSASASAIFKYRWKPNTGVASILSFDVPDFPSDDTGKYSYMFCVQVSSPSDKYPNGSFVLRPGYGGDCALPYAIEGGNSYDVEFARLKVLNGPNKGKYYVYFKLDGVLLVDEYVNANIAADGSYETNWNKIPVHLSNKIYITNWGGGGGHKMVEIPEPETLATDYDEIGVEDLYIGGKQAVRQYFNGTATYDQLSATKSVVFKYRWENRGNPSGWISFDRADGNICYLFGAQYSVKDKSIDLGMGYDGGSGTLPANIECGTEDSPTCYDVEFSRIKVLTGPNKGKYYVSFKIDDVLIAEDYAAVNADGTYTSKYSKPGTVSCALSNEIFMSCWGGTTKDTICEIHDETPAAAVQENFVGPNKTSYGTHDEVVYCEKCHEELSRKTVIDHLPTDMIIGTQTKENETRLIMKLTDTAEVIQSYKKVGFIVIVDGDKQSFELDSVYTGFYNIEGSELIAYTAADLDCTYVSILEIHDITEAETVTVQGFFIDDAGETTFGAIRTLR